MRPPVYVGRIEAHDGWGADTLLTLNEERMMEALVACHEGADPLSVMLGLLANAQSLDETDDEDS